MDKIILEKLDVSNIDNKTFDRLNIVTQEMWAHWIWEFVQCKCCDKMMSKKDIFGHLEKSVQKETVNDIMKILDISNIKCLECNWETDFVYWDKNKQNIIDRLSLSKKSHIVVARDNSWEIVWYMDWYVDDLKTIFYREYETHYRNIWVASIKQRVEEIIWNKDDIMVFSWIWFIEKYTNFFNMFMLLKYFFDSMTNIDLSTPAIAEVDLSNNIASIFRIMWYIPLWINSTFWDKITNKQSGYKSEMVIYKNPIFDFRTKFSMPIRQFLRVYWDALKEPILET